MVSFFCFWWLWSGCSPLPIPCRRLPSLPRQREVCSTGSQAMSPYGARQKPHIADDTALVGFAYFPASRQSSCKHGSALDFRDFCGKVGRRQFFKEHSERDALFFAQVPRLGYAYAATFRQCSSKLGTALNFRSFHHGRVPLLPKAANTAE